MACVRFTGSRSTAELPRNILKLKVQSQKLKAGQITNKAYELRAERGEAKDPVIVVVIAVAVNMVSGQPRDPSAREYTDLRMTLLCHF